MPYSLIPSENVAWISCGGGNSKLATFAFSVSILSAFEDLSYSGVCKEYSLVYRTWKMYISLGFTDED